LNGTAVAPTQDLDALKRRLHKEVDGMVDDLVHKRFGEEVLTLCARDGRIRLIEVNSKRQTKLD
jgi:hypothetical protein